MNEQQIKRREEREQRRQERQKKLDKERKLMFTMEAVATASILIAIIIHFVL